MFARSSRRPVRQGGERFLQRIGGIARPDDMLASEFKHALIRNAAYEALLKSGRKDLHRLVARTIDEEFSALKEAHPEVLARHWTQAGETEPAIAGWGEGPARRGDDSPRVVCRPGESCKSCSPRRPMSAGRLRSKPKESIRACLRARLVLLE
jgi:hypothetical protein